MARVDPALAIFDAYVVAMNARGGAVDRGGANTTGREAFMMRASAFARAEAPGRLPGTRGPK